MRALELSLRNYRVFEEVDLELPARVIGVFGPNGSGKSTLMESIAYACFGWSRTPKQQIRTHGLLTDCEVRLAFEHAGAQYEVRRQIHGKNHATDAELLSRSSTLAVGVTEVDAEMRRLLGMDSAVFRSSVFAEQKQLDAFSDLTKGERKKMVLRLLGIKPVDDARTAARKEVAERKRDVESLAGSLPDVAALQAELAELAGAAEAAEAAATQAREALTEAESRAEAADAAFTEADRVRAESERVAALQASTGAELDRAAKRAAELDARRIEASERVAGLSQLRTELEGLGDVQERLRAARDLVREVEGAAALRAELQAMAEVDGDAARSEYEAADAGRSAADSAAAEASAHRTLLERSVDAAGAAVESAGQLDPSEPCPTCGNTLGDAFENLVDHRRDELSKLQQELELAGRAAAEAAVDRDRAEKDFMAAREAAEAARTLLERRDRLAAGLQEADARVAALAEPFGDELPDVAELAYAATRAAELDKQLARLEADAEALDRLEADRSAAADEAAACGARLLELDREAAGLAFDPEDHARLAKEQAEAKTLLVQAREADREAGSRAKDAGSARSQAEGRLQQARETAERVGTMREDARYLERVTVLLDGFRDHLVARIGPELSREAEALFRELTNHEYEDLRISEEDLAIQIADGDAYFDIARFSGSETDLANLALRVAISVHLSRMSGADVGMLVLDEVLGSLDAERKDLMVQAMGRLADRFQQLFVVTHAEQIKDQFPASIEVRKAGRRRSHATLV